MIIIALIITTGIMQVVSSVGIIIFIIIGTITMITVGIIIIISLIKIIIIKIIIEYII